jgi:O-antigen/teichoic acid export membrane protein
LAIFFLGALSTIFIPDFIDIPTDYESIFIISIFAFTVWGAIKFQFLLPMLSLMGHNRIVAYNTLELLQGAGRPLLGAIIIYLKMGIVGIVAAYVFIEAIVLVFASKLMGILKKASTFNHETPKNIMSFGVGTSIVGISGLITLYSSSFIIAWSLGVEQVAIYQSTISLPLLALRICVIPFSNLLPKYISLYKKGGHRLFYKNSQIYHAIVGVFLLLLLSIVFLINKTFVALWLGESLFAGRHFSAICCVYVFLSVLRHNGYIVRQALGNIRMLVYGHLLEIVTTISLSMILVKNHGLIGIIYATAIGHLVPLAISQAFFIKKFAIQSS